MKCYLHIGTEKTGTSTIQAFFSNNRKQLAARGYYYPGSLGLPNNRLLPLAAFHPSRRDGLTNELKIFSDDALIAFQKEILRKFKEELVKLPSNATLISSSEHIQSRLTTIEEINNLKKILNEAGFNDITIIVYFRNPSETANSLFSETIKSGNLLHNVPPPHNNYYENICNHKKTVEKFASVFSKEKVVVRLFRKDKFIKHSLIHDIANIIGLDLNTDDLVFPSNQNESLSLLGLMILRKLNEKIPLFNEDGINNHRKGLEGFVSKHFSEPKFVMDEKLYQAYDAYFAESNQWIRDNYFPEEVELFPYKHPGTRQVDISEEELQKITDVIAELWISRSKILENQWYHFGKQTHKQKIITLYKYLLTKLRNR